MLADRNEYEQAVQRVVDEIAVLDLMKPSRNVPTETFIALDKLREAADEALATLKDRQ